MARPKAARGPAPRIAIRPGMKFGFLTIVQKVHCRTAGTSWRVQCVCGKRETTKQAYLLRTQNPKKSCGCKTYEGANPHKREKTIWQMMNRRCLYPTHVSYKYYGALGVKPCPEWIETNPNGWMNFIGDMGPAPTVQHSLDRINPHIGYGWYLDPEDGLRKNNCRWATATEQANNQKRHWAHWAPERIAAFKAAQEQEVVEAEVLEDEEEA